jgi:iron complex outermembrane recepter protein
MSKVTWLLTPIILIGALAGAAQAAPADPNTTAAAPTGTGDALQEIVVTAQKRAENINDVGMSITAVTGDQLVEKGVTNVSDLTRVEPSLQFSQTAYGTPVYTIRGIGYFEESLSASSAVAVYQDEVAYPFPVMSKGVLLDPERVEILKGPQGTLFGQNATAGAINFIAAKPTDTFTAGFDDTYGRFNDNRLSGFVSGPLTPTLNARLSASIEEGGAWQKSETRNDTLGNKDIQIARLILDWHPTEHFNASLNLNGWKDHSETQAGQLEGVYFNNPEYISPAALTPAFRNKLPYAGYYATYPVAVQNVVNQPTNLTKDQQADWTAGTHPRNDETFYQGSLRLDYWPSDSIGVTSLTSYQRFTEHNDIDEGGVGGEIPYAQIFVGGNVRTVSEELRLHGTFHDNSLHWLVGVNYENDRSKENDFFNLLGTTSEYLTGGSIYSPLESAGPPFGEPYTYSSMLNANTNTSSVFGNIDYRIVETVSVHGGVRYTRSDQSIENCSYGDAAITTVLNGLGATLAGAFGGTETPVLPETCVTLGPAPNFQPGPYRSDLDQSNVPWSVGVDWTPIEHQLLYVNVSKGYKAGASAAIGATTYKAFVPVTQESLLSYEVGAKTSLLDQRLQLNAAYFHYDYTNKQMLGQFIDPVFSTLQALVNIPKSKEDGAELSAQWRATSGLTLNAALTYLNSRVTSNFFNYSAYSLGAADSINFKGERFPFTPKWSLQYGARYDWSLTNGLSAFVGADASYQSNTISQFGAEEAAAYDAPSQEIKAYSLLNLTAGIQSADNRWRVELWGKNVTNTYYWTTAVHYSDGIIRLAGMPATYGVSLHYRY